MDNNKKLILNKNILCFKINYKMKDKKELKHKNLITSNKLIDYIKKIKNLNMMS